MDGRRDGQTDEGAGGACDLEAGGALTRARWSSEGSEQRQTRSDLGLLLGN